MAANQLGGGNGSNQQQGQPAQQRPNQNQAAMQAQRPVNAFDDFDSGEVPF